ncbi:hypothetical protein AC1031_015024 [Aphanomyces cochlioides]|nr:hypothetical protein AC1031_015024 [Aphanomyces cochlioides]
MQKNRSKDDEEGNSAMYLSPVAFVMSTMTFYSLNRNCSNDQVYDALHIAFDAAMNKTTLASFAGAVSILAGGFISELPADMVKLMDGTVDLCSDFVNDSPTKSQVLYMSGIVTAEAERIVNELIAAKKPKIGEFYHSCMDTTTINQLGLTPLDKELTMIRTANSSKEILTAIAKLSHRGVGVLVNTYVHANVYDFSHNASKIAQKDALVAYYNLMTFTEANTKYPLTLGFQLQAHGFSVHEGCSTDKIILEDLKFFDRVEALAKSTPQYLGQAKM